MDSPGFPWNGNEVNPFFMILTMMIHWLMLVCHGSVHKHEVSSLYKPHI
jgi:hypothetical protein